MHYSNLSFEFDENHFQHNVKKDFGLFAIWRTARPYLNEIRKRLEDNFKVLAETEIVWSEEHFESNAARLYEAPFFKDEGALSATAHREKIGGNAFIVFVVQDVQPVYTYARSVSGKIELSNLNIVQAKYALRDLVEAKTGASYTVHSTNNIREFFFQAPLLFNAEIFEGFLKGLSLETKMLSKDLEGAGGWENYSDMFQILNYTTDYLVLRGFDTLPHHNPEPDLDILATHYQHFASAVGASQYQTMPFKGSVIVGEQSVNLDMRYVGDKYYDPPWAKEMLRTKTVSNGVYVPRSDHYFFSLLFHAKVQKPRVKPKYYDILSHLAEQLGFEWFNTNYLDGDEQIGSILKGYFDAEGWVYEDPVDRYVYKNKFVIKHLPKPTSYNSQVAIKVKAKQLARRALPKPMIPIIKRVLKSVK